MSVSLLSFGLYVKVSNFEGMFLDKFSSRFDFIAHQDAKHLVCRSSIRQKHLYHRSARWVQGSVPQFFGVHFTQPLEPSDRQPLATGLSDRWQKLTEVVKTRWCFVSDHLES